MTPGTKDMTTGRPLSLLVRFALPLMVGNVFQQLYTVVDTMVVGKALGVGALAALGASDWLNWMMLGMIQGLTQGFAVLMAQAFGAKDRDGLRKTLGNSLVLCVISTGILLLLGQVFLQPVLRLMRTPDSVIGDSALYLRIMFGGIPIVMAYNFLACILRSVGDSKTPLYAMIVACGVNIGLDCLFVLLFGWGIPGAAAATLIAQVCSAGYCLLRLGRIDLIRFEKPHLRLNRQLTGKLLRLGISMAFQNYKVGTPFLGEGTEWVGLKWFKQFINGPRFVELLKNTLTLSLYSLVANWPFPILCYPSSCPGKPCAV